MKNLQQSHLANPTVRVFKIYDFFQHGFDDVLLL